jgi:2-hydroxycyclohexanecarboxyl-CoA dehydrogenase
VVTGGASGIGRATCEHLAAAGHRVGVLDLDASGAQLVADQLQQNGTSAVGIGVDVTDAAAVLEAFEKVRAELGVVLVLVTSAGLSRFDGFADMALDDWRQVLDVNLTGTMLACQAAIADMVPERWGRIVTISSSSAQRGSPRMAHYAAAKGGVIAMTKSIAREFAPYGITANSIPPSGIETPMQHAQQAAGDLPSNDVMAAAIPLGHLGTADDIAATATFLASDAAGFITGQVLGVNGGSVI